MSGSLVWRKESEAVLDDRTHHREAGERNDRAGVWQVVGARLLGRTGDGGTIREDVCGW